MQIKKRPNQFVFIVVILAALVSLTSCDSPRDQRSNKLARLGTGGSFGSGGSSSGFGDSSPTNAGDPAENQADDSSPGQAADDFEVPSDLSHCSWSKDGSSGFESSSTHLGEYTLCQSSASETTVHLQIKNPVIDSQICLVPTTSSGSTSVYIGEPRCLFANQSNFVYKIELYKNRPGYSGYSMTGIMVMKDKAFFYPAPYYQWMLSPDAYLFCINWLAQTGDPSYCAAYNSLGQFVYHQF